MPQSHTEDQLMTPLRKNQRTIIATWHLEHNKSKATSSLFPNEMIAKLERIQKPQNKTRTLHKTITQIIIGDSNNKQQQNYHLRTAVAKATVGVCAGVWGGGGGFGKACFERDLIIYKVYITSI